MAGDWLERARKLRESENAKTTNTTSSTRNTTQTSSEGNWLERARQLRYNEDTQKVDDDYINIFTDDVSKFWSSSQSAYDSMNWGNASDVASGIRKSQEGLDYKANVISRWLENNKGSLDEDSYRSVSDLLNTYNTNTKGILDSFDQAVKYYGQWETEDDYNTAVRYDGYSKKYKGATTEEIQKALETVGVGEERDWLQYYKGEIASDTARSNADFQKYASQGNTLEYTDFGTETWNRGKSRRQRGYHSIDKYRAASLALAEHYGNEAPLGNQNAYDEEVAIFRTMDDKEFENLAYYIAYDKEYGTNMAEQYVDIMEETLSQRRGTDIGEKVTSIDIPVIEDLAVLGYGAAAGLNNFAFGIEQQLSDEEVAHYPSTYANAYISDSLDGFGYYAHSAATTIGNMAPSILVSAALGGLGVPGKVAEGIGSATMGFSAAGNAYKDALSKGYDKDSARTYGNLVGASEGTLQYLIGGVSKLGGVSGKVAGKIAMIDNALLRGAAKLGVNIVGEITEEEVQNFLEPAFRTIIFGEDYDAPTIDELIETALVTMLSTGALEAGGAVRETRAESALNKAAIKEYGEKTDTLIQEGLSYDKNSDSYKLAEKYQAQVQGKDGKKGKDMTGAQIRNLITANQEQTDAKNFSETRTKAKDRLKELGEKNTQIWPLAELAAKYATGQELTRAEKSTLARSEFGAQVAQELIKAQETTKATYKSLTDRIGEESRYGVSERGQTEIRSAEAEVDGEAINIKEVSKIEEGQLYVETEDGREVYAGDIDFANESESYLYSAVADMENITPDAATDLVKNFDATSQQSVSEYVNGIDEAYNYGYHGYSVEDMKSGDFAPNLTEEQMMRAYRWGESARAIGIETHDAPLVQMRTAAEAKQTAEQKTAQQKARLESENVEVYFEDGSNVVKFDEHSHQYDEKRMAGVNAAKFLSKMGIGGKYYFYESKVRNGVRVYKNSSGNWVKAPNGIFKAGDGSIHIDLNAGQHGEGTTLFTLSHELTHFVKANSEKQFQTLADLVKDAYDKTDMTMHERVVAKQNQLAKNRNGEHVEYAEAYEEVVADAMSTMLADGNIYDKLAQLKTKDKGLFDTIKRFFDEMIAKFKELYASLTPDQKDAQDIRQMKEMFDRIQDAFAEALVEASDNFHASMESVVEAKAEPISADEIITDGAVVTDGQGEKHSIRSMKHDIAEGKMFEDLKTYCNWTDAQVKELRKQLTALVEYMTPHRDILDMNEAYGREGRRFSPYKPNSDPLYKISMDFSTLCSKRLLTQYVIENLQLRENRPMSAEEQMAIRDMLNEYRKVEKGLQVACAMCYVEAARLKSPKQIQRWLDDPTPHLINYFALKNSESNAIVKNAQADFKESKGYDRNAPKKDMKPADVKELNKIGPKLRSQYQLSAEEQAIVEKAKTLPNSTYLTAGNLANLSETDPAIYNAYTAFVRTATRSKSLETDEPYYYGDSRRDNGNGIIVSDSFIEAVNRENGMRFSSWSDWRIQHMLDYITAVIDNSVRGAAMHGYTKFGEEVRVLGKTGMMFNMSGVAGTQTGLNSDGSLSFSDTESIDVNEAIQLREEFPDTAGLQCIGVSNEHIIELLRSDIIDYVIPYHVSGLNADLRRMADIYGWKDYTSTQHAAIDKSIKFDNAADQDHWHEEPVYSEFFVGYDTDMTGVEAMRASAEKYKQLCKDRGLKPKFEQFAQEENYWKLLIDRKMVNQKNGKLIQQRAVTPTFDFAAIRQVVDSHVQNYDAGLEKRALNHIVDNWDSIPNRIKELKKGNKVKKSVDTLANQTLAAQSKDSEKHSDRFDDLPPSKYNALLRKKPINASKKDLAKVSEARMREYSGIDESDIPDLDIFSLAEYGKLNEGYLYFVRNNGKHNFAIIGKKQIIPAKRNVIREEQTAYEESNSRKKTHPNDVINGSGRRTDAGDSERSGNRGKLRENDAGTGFDEKSDQKSDTVDGTSNRRPGINRSDRNSDRDSEQGNAPVFYSRMGKVVEGMKQEKFGANSVISMLRGKGVKAEEIRWSGIQAFLEGKKSVTKADLLEFIKGSMLQIEDVVLGERKYPSTAYEHAQVEKQKEEAKKIENQMRAEFKRLTGEELGDIVPDIRLANSLYKKIEETNARRLNDVRIKNLRNKVQEVFDRNKNFGYESAAKALEMLDAYREKFIENIGPRFKLRFIDKPILAKYCNALNNAKVITAQDTRKLLEIADELFRVTSDLYLKTNERPSFGKYTEWKQYSLPGGQNYREYLFKISGSDYSNYMMRTHWKSNGAGVLAHARVQDFTVGGKDMLFVEEVQSDWHNEGRKVGYADKNNQDGVPDAPFKDNYGEYVMKRMLRMAAEAGYDSIGWSTAQIQDERWKNNNPHEEGTGKSGFLRAYTNDYDKKIRKFMERFGNQWGATVGSTVLDNGTEVWSMDITPAMKKSVLTEGQELYSERTDDSVSNRHLLANAFEGIVQNSEEYKMLQDYRDHIKQLNKLEDKLSDLNAEIRKIRFGTEGARDTEKFKKLESEAKEVAKEINRYDKRLLNMEASAPLRKVIDRERKKAAQKTREHVKEIQQNKKVRAEQAELRYKIRNFKKKLESKLLKPTDRQYVPVDLINAMVEVCDLIDTDTNLYNPDGSLNKAQAKRDETKEKLRDLKDAYEKLKTHSDPIYAGEFDEMVYTYLTELRDKFSDKTLAEMSLDELSEMYEILVAIDETLADARKLIGWGDAENVYEAGDAIVAEQNTITQKRKNGKRSAAQKGFDKIDNLGLSPVRNVERMSAYNQDSALLKLFKKFEQGIRKKNKFVMDAYKSFETLTSGKEYDDAMYKEVGGKKYEDVNGRKFGISKMQMMQAILSYERETANKMSHIAGSGFSFADLGMLRKGKLRDAISEEYSHRVPSAAGMVAEFMETLKDDKWCQDYMAAARKFFNETAKNAINETSIALKHRIIAKDKNYIPFEVDKNFVVREISAENDIQQTINSYGMLQDTKKGASQPLIITGLNNILDRHIDQVGNVYGLAIEVRNFNKVWNVRSKDDGGNNPSVKAVIQRNWGVGGVKHIEQTVQDIQGPRVRERSALADKVKSNYIGATFLLNLSVVTKQVGSLFSSTSLLKWRDPARMIGNLVYTMANSKKISAEVDKYTATAWMRRQGMSDAELYTLMTQAKKPGLIQMFDKAPAIVNPTKWITAMDHAVALSLWKYAKQDTAERTGLQGEELLKATAEFYDEVVENTQSMTDVLHRPEIQKRGDPMSEAFAMFKTDLYQMAGQLQATTGRYMAEKTKDNGKALARTVYSVAMGAIWGQLMTTVFALLRYKVDRYRDDEDDELTAESWLKRQGFALVGDLMGYVFPIFGSEIVGVFENIMYGEADDVVDNISLTAVNDLFSAMITLGSSFKDGEMPDAATIRKFTAKALQVFTPIPANNILRTLDAIQLHAEDIANGEFFSFNAGADSKSDKLYKATIRGDMKYATRLRGSYKSNESFHNAIRKALRENDPRIHEAAIAWNANDLGEYMRIAKEIIAEKHFIQDDVVSAIRSEANALLPDDGETSTSKAKGLFTVEKFTEAAVQGDMATAKAAKSDIIQTARVNGKTYEEAEKSFESSARTDLKEKFLEGSLTQAKAVNALTSYCGDTTDEAEKRVGEWVFEKKYGFTYSDRGDAYKNGAITARELQSILINVGGKTEEEAVWQVKVYDWQKEGFDIDSNQTSVVEDYETFCEPAHIDKRTYFDAYLFYKDSGEEGVKNSKVYETMPYIGKLPLTAAQKTALAKCWWAESTINKYKTW